MRKRSWYSMTGSRREANLKFIQRFFPALSARLATANFPSSELMYRLEPAKKQGVSLVVEAHGTETRLHSQYDPVNEARRWAAANPPRSRGVYILIGWGLGYHAMEWVRMHGAATEGVVVYEPEARWFVESLPYCDMPALVSAGRMEIAIGSDGGTLYQAMLRMMEPILSNDLFAVATPFAPVYPPHAVQTLREETQKILETKRKMLEFMSEEGERCQEHIYQNLRQGMNAWLPRDVKDIAKGEPAIIIAAGPSLNQNVKELANAQNGAWIIACDTSLRVLNKHGVQPHVVVTKDPTDLNKPHFEDAEGLENIVAAFDPQVHPEIVRKFGERKIYLPNRNNAIHRYIQGFEISDDDRLPLASNVAVAAFNLAVHLGCDPILLAGLDLCFDVRPGRSHADDSALVSETSFDAGAGKLIYQRGQCRDEIEVMMVEGVDGEMHPTTPSFYEALRLLEDLISRCGRRCIDVSEGGALIAGTEVLRLKDAITLYAQQPIRTEALFAQQPPSRGVEAFQLSLNEIKSHLQHCGEIAIEAAECIDKDDVPLNILREAREKIEDGFRVYHELQSALEWLMVEIRQPDYWDEEKNERDELIRRYHNYFSQIREKCDRFSSMLV
ncbi:MAG: DUF115 domain-containing protein [bacterium]|nr:DUF115 domain-containing protein [bacterium]